MTITTAGSYATLLADTTTDISHQHSCKPQTTWVSRLITHACMCIHAAIAHTHTHAAV